MPALRLVLALSATAVALIVIPVTANAAVGDLTQVGCIANAGASGCTDPTNDSLDDAHDLAVSNDGNSVYVTARSSSAITHFTRASDGTLTQTGCYSNAGEAGCVDVSGSSMGNPQAVVVSPDGTSVYVANYTTITEFDRAVDGSLTQAGCVNNSGTDGCANLPGDSLYRTYDIAISPDGNSVYAVGEDFMIESMLTSFDRAANGTLTQTGCLRNHGGTASGCTQIAGVTINTMHYVQRLIVSPDGASVYVTSIDNAVTHFSRAANGVLTAQGCISNSASGCTDLTVEVLSDPLGLVVSPDGSRLYSAAGSSAAIAGFARASNGTLAAGSCIASAFTGCTDLVSDSLTGAYSVAVSPDGKSLYSGAQNAINEFDIGVDGSLTEGSCFANPAAYGCTTSTGSTGGVYAIEVSPDGKSVYATSSSGDGILAFSREVPPAAVPPAAPDAPAAPLPPDTVLVSGANKRHRGQSASFKVAAVGTAYKFECRLRRTEYVPCNSRMTVNDLRVGRKYTFNARAIGPTGLVDPTPLTYSFRVVR